MKRLKIVGLIFVFLQLVFSVLTVALILKLDILPTFYVFLVVFVVALLFFISGLFVISRSRFRVWISTVFSALLSVFLAVAAFVYILPAINTLDNITTEKNTYLATYYILVKADDTAGSPADIKDYNIGVEKSHDFEAMKEALNRLAAEFDHTLNVIAYDNYSHMWGAFINNNETGAILMEANHYNIYKEYYDEQKDNISNYVKNLGEIKVEMEHVASEDNNKPVIDKDKDITKVPFVVYISGIDVSGKINQRSRSDVNILMAVNPLTKKITLSTVPRDAYVKIPGVTGDNYDKLTHAAIYGNNDCSVSIDTLEQNVYQGIEVDYWIRVNFTSLEKIVNALGGVEVYSEYSYTSTFSGEKVYFKKGMNTMSGWKALIFSRERVTVPGGEPQRGRNQLEVIKGIFNKITSPAILTSYNDVLEQVSENFITNMPMEHITALAKMQIDDGASWDFEMISVGVEYIYDYCYTMMDYGKLCVGILDEATRQEAISKLKATLEEK